MENLENCCSKLRDFFDENKVFLQNPIIKKFMENDKNYEILKNYICYPTPKNKDKLDHAFKEFYFNIRFTSYVSSTLHFSGINLDKEVNKRKNRFPLLLDQPVSDNTEITNKDIAIYNEDFDVKSNNLLDYITDPVLYKAVERLTSNQRKILYLVYIEYLTDSKVGKILKKSQQTVSKSRKKALEKIRRFIEEKTNN